MKQSIKNTLKLILLLSVCLTVLLLPFGRAEALVTWSGTVSTPTDLYCSSTDTELTVSGCLPSEITLLLNLNTEQRKEVATELEAEIEIGLSVDDGDWMSVTDDFFIAAVSGSACFSSTVMNLSELLVPDENGETALPAELEPLINEEGYFDFEDHVLYIRARCNMTLQPEQGTETIISSAWCDPLAYTGESKSPGKTTDCAAPEISDCSFADDTLTFSIDYVPDSVRRASLAELVGENASCRLEVMADTGNGWEREAVDPLDRTAIPGYHTVLLPEAQSFDVRARYVVIRDGEEIASIWSDTISYNNGVWSTSPTEVEEEAERQSAIRMLLERLTGWERTECSLCGYCTRPLNLCILIWVLILLGVIVLALLVVSTAIKPGKTCPRCGIRCGRNSELCWNCLYSFAKEKKKATSDNKPEDKL